MPIDASTLPLINGFRYELEKCFDELLEQEKEFKDIKVPSDKEGWTLEILSPEDRKSLEDCIQKFYCQADSYQQIKINQEVVELAKTIYLKYEGHEEKGRFFHYKSLLCDDYDLDYKNNIYVESLRKICSLFISVIQEFILYKLENDFDRFYAQSRLDRDFDIYDYRDLGGAMDIMRQSVNQDFTSYANLIKQKNMPILMEKISSGTHPNDLLKYIENYNPSLFIVDGKKIYRELFKVISKGFNNINNLPRHTTAGSGRPKRNGHFLDDKVHWISLNEDALLCCGFVDNLMGLGLI